MCAPTQEQILAFLAQDRWNKTCEVCRGQEWFYPSQGPSEDPTPLFLPTHQADENVSFVAIICAGCGNTRFMHSETILKSQE
ncbi:hypothetical protein ATO8_00015 [Roseivivax marinus]|uniref:Uncharacterized protein n=1 Tax=Roseivivax marinus TaxID=1379903 RepID=W4HQ49_9RHOB|nr:hypothetical protein ATO8_00015 [Roseivivax marinus]